MSKPDLVADRPVISLRATPDLRDMLVEAARQNSRSLSQEIEHRVRASFAGQDQRAMMREVVAEALAERDAAEIAAGNRIPNDPMLEALWARHDA